MAKDDYDVIVYRVLVYYYACLKRNIEFDNETFNAAVRKSTDSEAYLNDVLNMTQDEGLLTGLSFMHAWGNDLILTSELSEARITPAGVRYLKDNSSMRKAGEFLKECKDTVATLAGVLELIK